MQLTVRPMTQAERKYSYTWGRYVMAQAAAMLAGSMFSWACPDADPADYDEQGRPVKREGAT